LKDKCKAIDNNKSNKRQKKTLLFVKRFLLVIPLDLIISKKDNMMEVMMKDNVNKKAKVIQVSVQL
jgi:hypothetical protein